MLPTAGDVANHFVSECFDQAKLTTLKGCLMKRFLLAATLISCVSLVWAADKLDCEQMIAFASSGNLGLKDALLASLSEAGLKKGNAFLFHGGDFFFAVESNTEPGLRSRNACFLEFWQPFELIRSQAHQCAPAIGPAIPVPARFLALCEKRHYGGAAQQAGFGGNQGRD